MLNCRMKGTLGVVIAISQVVTGCTGLAPSNKKPVALVQGPPITDIFTPFLAFSLALSRSSVRE